MKHHLSLLARIYLSTAVAVTVLLAVAAWFFEHQASAALYDSVEQEARSSLRGVDSLWKSRADLLAAVSLLFASMSDVRAAFGTRDEATIRDTAGELWARVVAGSADAEDAAFAVADPAGMVLASQGRQTPSGLRNGQPLPPHLIEPARQAFPKQSGGFASWDGTLWQVIATPVYVNSGTRDALLNILLAAHPVTEATLRALKERTGGSDFLLRLSGAPAASTLSAEEAQQVIAHPERFAIRKTQLRDGAGQDLGELWAVRSLADVESRVSSLRRTLVAGWLIAMSAGLALSYLLARRIVRPVRALNDAAHEVSLENYAVRVAEDSSDELGVLTRTFNRMCASIESARAEKVRSGKIAAIGRLAASLAHDLRNPLAAVIGGAEMLAEFDLPPDRIKQTGVHIHQAGQRMQELLSELSQVAQVKPGQRVRCAVADLAGKAAASQQARAGQQGVKIVQSVDGGLAVECEKSRIERVLVNLIANSLEVMPGGGEITIAALRNGGDIWIDVRDTGPGIPGEIRGMMFEPFVTAGKKNGLGLGLALARQTLLDQGGDLELLESPRGAWFRLRLPGAEALP